MIAILYNTKFTVKRNLLISTIIKKPYGFELIYKRIISLSLSLSLAVCFKVALIVQSLQKVTENISIFSDKNKYIQYINKLNNIFLIQQYISTVYFLFL